MSTLHTVIGLILQAGLTWLSRRRLPQTEGTLHLPGLEGPVEIIRDRWGVPHIYADTLNDLFFAQGFVHAQDRLWQMEINRRIATGHLSELFGEIALDTDRLTRTFGFRRLAEADLSSTGELRDALEAYASGVNAFLDQADGRLPVEFTLLRHQPEPWSPLDSLAWARVMIWNLSHAWASEIVRARLVEKLGPERAAELEIRYPEQLNVTGVSLPGVPLVMVGHNAHIAWGMTLAFTDCEDLFVEQFHPEDPHQYQFQGEWRDAEVVRESISVKGRATPYTEEVIITHHGPVISDVVGYPTQRLAVQSMALRPCPAIQGWFQLNQARGWDDFVAAMRLIEAPQLNVVYADVDGNIGYWVTGKVPVRARGQGLVPAPGWNGEYEWVGEIPFEEMPHALTVCQTAYKPHDPYDVKAWAPSYRQIVDLGDFSRSMMASPLGQSGQLGSSHHEDLIEPWLKGEYQPMLWTREQVVREAEGRLWLKPGAGQGR